MTSAQIRFTLQTLNRMNTTNLQNEDNIYAVDLDLDLDVINCVLRG